MISLNNYINKRNGVPLGHSSSLKNMLTRSLGAKSFDLFWVYWNPIWNYYLYKYVFKILKQKTNNYVAVIITFSCSGFIHDLVGLFIYKRTSLLFTIWFLLMGVIVVIFKIYKLTYKTKKRELNYVFNTALILASFCLTKYILNNIYFFNFTYY